MISSLIYGPTQVAIRHNSIKDQHKLKCVETTNALMTSHTKPESTEKEERI